MKYISLDLGSVTCGIAKSDTGLISQAVKTIRFKENDYNEAINKIEDFINEYKPDLIVMGYPLLNNDDEGPRAKISREIGEIISKETGIEVVLQDERYTTSESIDLLIKLGKSRKKRKKIIDQEAACKILDYYLLSKK